MANTNGRSYSDPSYGSKKTLVFDKVTCGTRATGNLQSVSFMHPILVTDVNIIAQAAGSGAASSWTLKNGTTVIATVAFATNATAGTVVEGVATAAALSAGSVLHFGVILGTCDPNQTCQMNVEYVETFEAGDN